MGVSKSVGRGVSVGVMVDVSVGAAVSVAVADGTGCGVGVTTMLITAVGAGVMEVSSAVRLQPARSIASNSGANFLIISQPGDIIAGTFPVQAEG